MIVVAVDDAATVLKIVELVKAEFPHTPVLARAFDREHAVELLYAGATFQVRESLNWPW